jgi:hypothetical protein
MSYQRLTALTAATALLLSQSFTPRARSYTQSGASFFFGNGIPMGHEWVTRMAAVELLGYSPLSPPDLPDPQDPRKHWTQGLPKNLNLSKPGAQVEVAWIKGQIYNDQRYLSRYKSIFDAIIGERWVDIAGYNIGYGKLPGQVDCWDAVAQEPPELQYDHFMRRYDEVDGYGAVTAATNSQQRFIQYFVAAATAPTTEIQVYDGGGGGSTAVNVDRNFFLFGRAAHLFEDSFSSEHTVRTATDNYTTIHQVKSYLCAPGSEQHTHSTTAILNYSSGDVVWNPGTGLNSGWSAYKASNMKIPALVAVDATKDLWAAFIRTMGTPISDRQRAAQGEATTLVNNWLNFNQADMDHWYDNTSNRDSTYVLAPGESAPGQTVQQCMEGLDVGTDDQRAYVKELAADQRECIYNAVPWPGYQDLADTSMNMYFDWHWLSPVGYETPPPTYVVPKLPADTGLRVSIESIYNGQFMSAPTLTSGAYVYNKPGQTPLGFIQVGSNSNAVFRVISDPDLFLSYTSVTGAVELYAPSPLAPTNYELNAVGSGYSIMSISWGPSHGYMNLNTSTQSPYVNSSGNPQNAQSQWQLPNAQ